MLGFIGDLLSLTRIREQAVQWSRCPHPSGERAAGGGRVDEGRAERKDIFLEWIVRPTWRRSALCLIRSSWCDQSAEQRHQYTDPCGIVQVSLSQDAGQLIGTVRDTGLASARRHTRIFDEFYRASNARWSAPTARGGPVDRAAHRRKVGGKVWVDSESNLGTKFTFVLPRADS